MAILHEIFRNYVLFTHVKAFCQMHYYYSGKRNYYAIMWHAMAFKLSFQRQSPGSPHLSQPYGGTFYCNSEMRWLELHPHRRKELHSWSLHLPPPMGQGISRAFVSSPLFFASLFYFSFVLNFPCSSRSVTIHFISLSPHCISTQNTEH